MPFRESIVSLPMGVNVDCEALISLEGMNIASCEKCFLKPAGTGLKAQGVGRKFKKQLYFLGDLILPTDR
ncbi:MAG: hypothetical protein AMK69_20650 [Nitrospira bacterium SG8_3]|nr:MAG: hypothetical protein AMK69_20650 [Nitrospira bacterium SG8_3]